jgi:hypothetical protein
MNNILLADKGNATIIMATMYYHNKMASLLHDTIYRCLSADPTAKTERKTAMPVYIYMHTYTQRKRSGIAEDIT